MMESLFHSQQVSQAVPQRKGTEKRMLPYDTWLIAIVVTLVCTGLILVVSTTVSIAERRDLEPLYFFWRQLGAAALGTGFALVLMRVPLQQLEKLSTPLLFLGIVSLIAVLIPGLGHEVNGSMRWISLGVVSVQPSEPVKLIVVIYLAAYLVRHSDQVQQDFAGFVKPIGVLVVVSALLLREPDFGTAVVLFTAALGMLFLAGVPLFRFFFWGGTAFALVAAYSMQVAWRWQRYLAYRDPWADPYDYGYQLTQALIAFGRGEWFGVGIGNSIQKLDYLPEVHTDFVFAVIGEELGLFGTVTIILLFVFLTLRILYLGGIAARSNLKFAAYVTYGIGLLLGTQAFVNIGVNLGLLPTKGLPLPFLSYGNNNLVVTLAAMGLVCRSEFETRLARGPLTKETTALG